MQRRKVRKGIDGTLDRMRVGEVIERVRTGFGQQTVRIGLGFYRDEGDLSDVRDFPFTTDVDLALRNLAAQDAPAAVTGRRRWERGSIG